MEIPNEIPVKKPKRLTSVVWNHFERVRKGETCYAVCIHCKKKLSGSSNSGTTHLRNHLVRCLKRSNHDVTQILSAKRKRKEGGAVNVANITYDDVQHIKEESIIPITYKFDQEPKKEETFNLGSVKFDPERSRMDLARMIMLHDYRLAMVEDVGFRTFVKNLQPLFDVMSRSSVELDCMNIYGKEKQRVFEMLHDIHGRISLAVCMWSSPENVTYFCLTAYYVDEDWKLKKKLLNFKTLDSSQTDESLPETMTAYYADENWKLKKKLSNFKTSGSSQTDDSLSEAIIKCLVDWDIEHKLFSMTLDDCFTFDDISLRAKDWITQNKLLLKNGELFDVRCAAHLVKSIILDAMDQFRDVIKKIRDSVMHAKSSEAHGKFIEIAQQLGIDIEKRLVLDTLMRWNSTCSMLESALEYKGAFLLLQQDDPTYTSALSDTEWEWANSVAAHMKLLVDVTNVFSQSKHPTANIYFPELCDVHIQLMDWCKSNDEFVRSVAVKIKRKFIKYWNKCSLVLAIAAILDPRFKMKLVEYYYPQIYGPDASVHIRVVSNTIKELFNEYSMGPGSLDQNSNHLASSLPGTSNGTRDRLRGFDKFLHETSQGPTGTSDLDKYLEEPVFPRNHDFNILNWWKVHTPRYPILSMMARDILGIPVSNLTPSLAFSTRGRVLEHHLSSLSPDVRQALICGQDWLRMESEDNNPSSSRPLVPLPIET